MGQATYGILFLLLIVVFASMLSFRTSTELASVEIREYQGEKLGSMNDFRENSIKGPQDIVVEEYRLEVTGLVETPKEYTYKELLEFTNYSKVVTLDCVEGWSVKILWEGPLVSEVLGQSKPLSRANTIIFYAEDGYSTSFPVEYITENDIIIAHHMNNVTLDARRGFPFQLVAESKWGYKWIKWITRVEFSDNDEYTGYWESRGYSNTGNLDETFLGGH